MKYLYIVTNNLVALVGRNNEDKIDWLRLGTSPKVINLSSLNINKKINNELTYLLPIADVDKVLLFIAEECTPHGIVTEVLDESQAEVRYQEMIAAAE